MNELHYVVKDNDVQSKLKAWIPLEDIESSAMEQIDKMVTHPRLFKHIAIMPDVHMGHGATIGAVIPIKGAVIPSAVGVDIGCGMAAIKTDIPHEMLTETVKEKLHEEICKRIPMGFNHRTKSQKKYVTRYASEAILSELREYQEMTHKNIFIQLGTLGGGNHFIELQKDKNGFVWIMLHSGSRNIGHTIAQKHIKKAKEIRDIYLYDCPSELEYLSVTSPEGKEYLKDMNFSLRFAFENRKIMMEIIKHELEKQFSCDFETIINIHHNYASLENHFGENVWVHRKGATRVRDNILGIIPGSMGDKSYIVKGLNNNESYHSCSHGAGRTMSRTKAKQIINIEHFKESMKDVYSKDINEAHIDESPFAYKQISKVMNNQKELVEIIEELTPIFNMKG